MRFTLLFILLFSISLNAASKIIPVKNLDELNRAVKSVMPGDTVVLQNGIWKDVIIKINVSGTDQQPIIFKAQTAGKVRITGISQLRLGGNYLVIDGLYFTEGYSPASSVIEFRTSDQALANNCRVTNCVIDNFNKPKRMDDDNWIAFYGKGNRLDHCSFLNKKNMGVLLAVILTDERSRENFHSIDHNYFGRRQPLASNGGEIIRVGVSQHAQFNSNTLITDNFFQHCDGEAEIISIKSGGNIVRDNLIVESQGSVVLRHGDNNTVVNNIFLGNDKPGTGGVRIINKGQWVINNFFYKLRGTAFRSPMAIMNGIPNSPAHRYVQVTDAVILNNSFYECAPLSFGEGKDEERTLPPDNVFFSKNIFFNSRDTAIYRSFDKLDGFRFSENFLNVGFPQYVDSGFIKTRLSIDKSAKIEVPRLDVDKSSNPNDSITVLMKSRGVTRIFQPAGFQNARLLKEIVSKANLNTGAAWFPKNQSASSAKPAVSCPTAASVYKQVRSGKPLIIQLTGDRYTFDQPVVISANTKITTNKKKITFASSTDLESLFILKNGADLELSNLFITASGLSAGNFISTDSTGSAEHFNLILSNVHLANLEFCESIFNASRATLSDSIIIHSSTFTNFSNGFLLKNETEDKGYYNVEKIRITNSRFKNGNGLLLDIYRGGNDESTLGPNLQVSDNVFDRCNTSTDLPLIKLTGVQQSHLSRNRFTNCNPEKILIHYKDRVRARHLLVNTILSHSGRIQTNEFVSEQNTIRQ